MDDFSFDAPASKKTDFGSDDPTADFLAREQAILGDDADFLAGLSSGSAVASLSNNPSDDFESNFPSFAEHEVSLSSPPVSGKNNDATVPSVAVAADDDFGAFHSDYPVIETTDSIPVSQAYAASIPIQATGASSGFRSPSPSLSRTPQFKAQEVPEVIREWREKQAAIITEKDERSETKRQETIGAAHEAIDRFYEDYNQKKAKSIAENRDKEAAFLAKRDDVSSGTQWERINRHLDNSPAAVAAALKAGRRDTSRMRELLRDLEKDPNAPGK
ncbi:hypothetical protein BX616_001260 [Lobosporangium transversale]|uniref:Clathrin light chain n=1 Tax=Lobosporangium transversale TaxID=64571 RepID=A0A1Y2GUX0_9FUNG|nr:clathrin light chain-domain-containing protein [Lobosporangium transversale]KAF9917358.1 hypothetical protein BX616_001260 [Lobosporangium transversale]ORZ24854.1 clathrin light chain-domain-containing protein [Lobosporangium transversale]|eukprot:XP_021883835.1 clathrin light chain-domain-containing protein [Lobosporangium transversale]